MFEHLIKAVTQPEDLSWVRSAGGGACPVAAVQASRRVIASDIDLACVETTTRRLCGEPPQPPAVSFGDGFRPNPALDAIFA